VFQRSAFGGVRSASTLSIGKGEIRFAPMDVADTHGPLGRFGDVICPRFRELLPPVVASRREDDLRNGLLI
jgi:hypothetical protein